MTRKKSITPNAKIRILKDLILSGYYDLNKTPADVFLSPGQEYKAEITGNTVKVDMDNFVRPVEIKLEDVEVIEQL